VGKRDPVEIGNIKLSANHVAMCVNQSIIFVCGVFLVYVSLYCYYPSGRDQLQKMLAIEQAKALDIAKNHRMF